MLPKDAVVWDHILILSILVVMMFTGTLSMAAPEPAPQGMKTEEAYFDNTTPTNVTSLVGQNVILSCKVLNLNGKTVAWLRERDLHLLTVGLFTYSSDARFQVIRQRDSNEWGLRIRSVNFRDAGTYECQVSSRSKITKRVVLTVKEPKPEIPATGKSLVKAVKSGNLEDVKYLVKKKVDVDFNHGAPLYQAADIGHTEIVKYLLNHHANPQGTDLSVESSGSPLRAAALENHVDIIDLLLDAGAKDIRDMIGGGPIEYAASRGHLEAVKRLLLAGFDPNKADALTLAATGGYVEVVRTLLEAGAIIKYENSADYPMHHAAMGGHSDVITLLVEYGSEINRVLELHRLWSPLLKFSRKNDKMDGYGCTAMHVAARFGYPITQELVELGANINIQDAKGRTPLHMAIQFEKSIVAKDLLRFCADLTLTNEDGKTVHDMAKDLAHKNGSSHDSSDCNSDLMTFLDELLNEEVARTPANRMAASNLAKKVWTLMEANSTLKETLRKQQVDKSVTLANCFLRLFEERARKEMVGIIEGHKCTATVQKEKPYDLGTEYLARCDCIPGQGPRITFTPLQEANLCAPVLPVQEEEGTSKLPKPEATTGVVPVTPSL